MASAGVILFAEDNRQLRKLYSDALTMAGYNVVAVSDGREALRLLSVVCPKLIVLDIQMPEMNGVETCAQARKICGDEVPIIFLTALDQLEFLHEGIAAGGDDYIIKSEGIQPVIERVGRWMHRTPGRKPLAARRSGILSEVAAEVGRNVPFTGAADKNDDSMRELADFLSESRTPNKPQGVETTNGKSHLLGYVTGVVEYWMESRRAAAERFMDYVRFALRETGLLAEHEIHALMSRFDELIADPDFSMARANGRNDPAKWENSRSDRGPVDPDRNRKIAEH